MANRLTPQRPATKNTAQTRLREGYYVYFYNVLLNTNTTVCRFANIYILSLQRENAQQTSR